jgi:iron complex transport system permease protein
MRDKTADRSASLTAEGYLRQERKKNLVLILLTVVLLAAAIISLFIGSNDLRFSNFLSSAIPSLGEKLGAAPLTKIQSGILWQLRLPRVLCAMGVGAVPAVCGTIMQATTGNIMASPYTTGISSAAAFGAAIGILFQPLGSGGASTVVFAFAFGMVDAAVVYGITAATNLGAGGMILVGVALNFLFSSANSLLQYIASDDKLSQIVHWSFGTLTGVTWMQILVIAASFLVAMIVFMRLAWPLNVMSSGGDESAKALGVDPNRVRVVSGVLVTIVAAITISFIGVIGFVGLVAPHVARILIGSEHRKLLPGSMLLGALLVLIADTIGRTIVAPTVIPVGVVLSVVGAPLFVYLILAQNRRRLY